MAWPNGRFSVVTFVIQQLLVTALDSHSKKRSRGPFKQRQQTHQSSQSSPPESESGAIDPDAEAACPKRSCMKMKQQKLSAMKT